MESAIRIESVSFSYDSRRKVLEDFSLAVADNEFTAIIGRNGCGKTTLLKIIAGLLRPAQGDIYIRGKNIRHLSVPAISAEAGFVMQNPDRQLFAETVYDEAAFALRNAKLPEKDIKPRVEAALEAAGLAGEREKFPLALGRGERVRAVIAAVLAMGSRILILDEPAAGQDHRNTCRIMEMLLGLREKGYTVVFVTHNMSLAAEYARRVIVMREKMPVTDGTAAAVFSRAGELAAAGMTVPPIIRLQAALREEIPLVTSTGLGGAEGGSLFEKTALNPAEMGEMLLALKRGG